MAHDLSSLYFKIINYTKQLKYLAISLQKDSVLDIVVIENYYPRDSDGYNSNSGPSAIQIIPAIARSYILSLLAYIMFDLVGP